MAQTRSWPSGCSASTRNAPDWSPSAAGWPVAIWIASQATARCRIPYPTSPARTNASNTSLSPALRAARRVAVMTDMPLEFPSRHPVQTLLHGVGSGVSGGACRVPGGA